MERSRPISNLSRAALRRLWARAQLWRWEDPGWNPHLLAKRSWASSIEVQLNSYRAPTVFPALEIRRYSRPQGIRGPDRGIRI